MKIDKDNWKRYKKTKAELLTFFNKQSVNLHKAGWNLQDHVALILDICVFQMKDQGFNDDDIRIEIDAILMSYEDRDKRNRLN